MSDRDTETTALESVAESQLSKSFGLPGATALGVGTMIAGGIFVLSGLAVANVGAAAILSFVLAGLIVLCTAMTYAELATIYPYDGGGYAYAEAVFESDWTYLVGWVMILGYPASAAFYVASFALWFYRFLWPSLSMIGALPFWIPGLLVLAILIGINIAGAEESGRFQIVVTGLKIVLIGLFLVGGFQAFDPDVIADSLATNVTNVDGVTLTAGLVFITFFGFEVIATSEGEIESPEKNVPRAIFLSLGIVTLLYVLVIGVVVLAVNDSAFVSFLVEQTSLESAGAATEFLSNHGEVTMARAAQYYLGDIGFYIIVVGALLSMVSAANATILGGSRVKFAMGQRDHLPTVVTRVSDQTSTPVIAIVLTGALILLFYLLFTVFFGSSPAESGAETGEQLGLEALAHFADFMLLSGLTLVNVALIQSRRKHPDLERHFRVPAVPWIPLIGILANLALLGSLEEISIALGTGAIVLGMLGWLLLRETVTSQA